MRQWLMDFFTNPYLITALSSWLIAQVMKFFIHIIVNKEFDLSRIYGDGGMPSGHSATVTSLAMISALYHGLGSFQFAVTFILATIVCHDAMGVRRETGKQAVLLNELVRAFEELTADPDKLPEVKLKEFVGHTPVQVTAGILLGIATACGMYFFVFA